MMITQQIVGARYCTLIFVLLLLHVLALFEYEYMLYVCLCVFVCA